MLRVIMMWLWVHGVMVSMFDFHRGEWGSCDYEVVMGHGAMVSTFDFHQGDWCSCDYQVVMGPWCDG